MDYQGDELQTKAFPTLVAAVADALRSDEPLEALRAEAVAVGDSVMAGACWRASQGCDAALNKCARFIAANIRLLADTVKTIETRAILAGCYRGRALAGNVTHAVSVDGASEVVLCGRVSPEHLADPHACDTAQPPTCKACRKKDPRGWGLPPRREATAREEKEILRWIAE